MMIIMIYMPHSEKLASRCMHFLQLHEEVAFWDCQENNSLPGFQNRGPPLTLPYEATPQNHPAPANLNLKKLMVIFMSTTDNRINIIEVAQKNQEASIQNLEKQIGQLVKLHVNAISVKVDEEIFTEREVMIVQERDYSEEKDR
ncbi:hypothetical protein M9H77_07707 [Catharanthus roseus]|uniref:Uncharacterized protein n=1 Tax=Catharanthus roseus TaxID=4058 RepID=A0ACC0BVX7_CATRO|nr:hypothetical protein M9H77_07707 [Catharanthus roseus]